MAAALSLSFGVASLLATGVSGQATNERVWNSVAFIYHGERLPLQTYRNPALTPLGAQQMFAQGEMFRARYLLPNISFPASLNGITTSANIQGLEPNGIDNTQINVLTNTDAYMGPSAMAFMQGLYPARNQTMSSFSGGMDAAELADGTVVNYPLDGYQYPKIQTLSSLDPSSTWIQGQADCAQYLASADAFAQSATAQLLTNQTEAFFSSLYYKFFWPAGFRRQEVTFTNAYKLYDFALFNYTHEPSPLNRLSQREIDELARLANVQQQNLNADLSISGRASNDKIRAVSGRMLAGKIVSLMRDNLWSGGSQAKLSLMFGAHQPFLAFFALSGLINGNTRQTFDALPRHGASMVFETFTVDANSTTASFPRWSDMWVRFLYRPSANASSPMAEHPLFGNGNQQTHMRLEDFLRSMDAVAFDSFDDWCYTCNSTTVFCAASQSAGSSGGSGGGGSSGSASDLTSHGSSLSPGVAGAIGAVAAICAVALGMVLAVVLGGVRFASRRLPEDAGQQRESTGSSFFSGGVVGGFKGAEKKEADPDVAYARGGARHERHGSWELRGGGGGDTTNSGAAARSGAGASVVATSSMDATLKETAVEGGEVEEPRLRQIDDDAGSVFSATPVKPRESV